MFLFVAVGLVWLYAKFVDVAVSALIDGQIGLFGSFGGFAGGFEEVIYYDCWGLFFL